MGFFKSLARAGFDAVLLPVEIVKDVATMGNSLADHTGYAEPFTWQRLKKIGRDLEDARDALE